VGVEEGELLAAVNPILRVVDVEQRSAVGRALSRRGTWAKLSQNSSTMAAIMRFSAKVPGRFSSREMVG